jgi:hypothetical protein
MQAHLAECTDCRTHYKELEQEQQQFEQQISFDRFAAGVERASRSAHAPSPEHWFLVDRLARTMQRALTTVLRPRRWLIPAMGMAAAMMVGIVVGPLVKDRSADSGTRIKGGAHAVLRVGGPASGAQRTVSAQAPEALSPGERVRIGYQPGKHRFLIAVSLDEQGVVSPLYPETGSSIPAGEGDETRYLPDSLEFTGHGVERVIVVLTDRPLEVSDVQRAARDAYQEAGGNLRQIRKLKLGGEQFHWLLLKP